ncbi:19961_t:CDS:2, partial [Racocetra persica]
LFFVSTNNTLAVVPTNNTLDVGFILDVRFVLGVIIHWTLDSFLVPTNILNVGLVLNATNTLDIGFILGAY